MITTSPDLPLAFSVLRPTFAATVRESRTARHSSPATALSGQTVRRTLTLGLTGAAVLFALVAR